MRFFAERMKMVVEPTGCLAFAGAVADAPMLRDARVGVIVSGGNVDLARYATLLELHVARLRDSFVVSSRPPRIPSRATSAELRNGTTGTMDFLNSHAGQSALAGLAGDVTGMMPDDDWLALPFDPAMADLRPRRRASRRPAELPEL